MNPDSPFHARIERSIFSNALSIFFFRRQEGVLQVIPPVSLLNVAEKDACINPEPSMILKIDEGQELMDELWRAGLRPSEGTGSAGAMAATERRLLASETMLTKCLDTVLALATPKKGGDS